MAVIPYLYRRLRAYGVSPEQAAIMADTNYQGGNSSSGGGGVDETAVNALIDTKVNPFVSRLATVETVTEPLAAGGDPSQVLTKASDNDGDITWAAPATATAAVVKAWTASPLLYAYDFTNGFTQPGWNHGNEQDPPIVAAADVPTGKPAYSYFLKQDYPYGQSYSRFQMSLENTGAFTNKTITRLKCWVYVESSNGGAAKYTVTQGSGGIDRYTANIAANGASTGWVHVDVPWNAVVDIFFVAQGNTRTYMSGVEIYGTAEPYGLNDLVRYNGQYWRSLSANNPYQPGVQGWASVS